MLNLWKFYKKRVNITTENVLSLKNLVEYNEFMYYL